MSSVGCDGKTRIGFGRFRLDLQRRVLACDGRPVRLGGRPLDILCILGAAGGGVVGKDELMERLWPGRAVEEGNLHVHMSALRRALGENGGGHSYIVTVPGRGYRLAGLGGYELAGVEEVASQPPAASAGPDAVSPDARAAPGSQTSCPKDAQILERRQLTVVSCEVVQAARLAAQLDPEELRHALSAVFRRSSEIITSLGGRVARLGGEIVLGYFGHPQAGEHDAEQAIRAGLALIEGIRNLESAGTALQVRLGIATGPVIVGDLMEDGGSEGGLIGETVTLAAALRQTGEPGTAVIAEGTRRLVGDLFELERRQELRLEGFDELVVAYKVLRPSAVVSRFEALRGSCLTPLVGRDEEIDLLLRRWQRAKCGELQVVLITGEPGIGKSRLCAELQERVGPHACIQYFCSPHHQDAPLYPVVRQLESASGIQRSDAPEAKLAKLRAHLSREAVPCPGDMELFANILSLDEPGSLSSAELPARRRREITFEALLRQLESVSRSRAVLIVFEDAHWSDATTLELLDMMLGRAVERPVLILITFRPEFEAPWTGQAHVTTMTLRRLDRRESATLVRGVVGGEMLATDLVHAIAERADGVPLFLEELSKALAESDEATGPASVPHGPAGIPTTLRASLMARLDRLPLAKHVAQIGAAIGREFPYGLLEEVGGVSAAQLAQGLQEFVAAGLATARGSPPDVTYMFKHALVQDAAYESLPQSRRMETHAAVVAACERNASFNVEPAVLAHWCVQAGLIAKAIFYYRAAAQRSMERAAVVETRRQLQRGLAFAATLPEGRERHELEADLLLALATVLQTTAGMTNAAAGQLLGRATEAAQQAVRPELLSRAMWGQFTNVLVRGEVGAARTLAERLLDVAEGCDEVNTQLAAHAAMGIALYTQGHFERARRHLAIQQSQLESHSKTADLDWRTVTAGPAFLALTLACAGYPEQAEAQLDRAIAVASARGSFALAYSLSVSMRVLIILRNDDALREHAMRLIALSEEGGFHQFLNNGLCALGWLEAKTGAPRQGLDRLCKGIAGMVDLAVVVSLPLYRSLLADARCGSEHRLANLAELDEALNLSARTGDNWFTAELHRQRGELLLGAGLDSDSAERELQQALAIAREQSAKLFELRAAMSLARLWRTQQKPLEAADLLAEVQGWFTEGSDAPDLKEARRLLDRAPAPIGTVDRLTLH